GVLFLVPPDRFAMRFEEPEGDRIVADGEWLWAYTPSTVPDQVIRQPIPRFGVATPNLFGQFVDDRLVGEIDGDALPAFSQRLYDDGYCPKKSDCLASHGTGILGRSG
ncbi:MAG: hypothetical protein IH831_11745, partial [Planctomycetes bacterium]|nr:hypothetical protein [Planctomycetota bacterium]